jgi:LPXTG-motif cell wall-anchored protein
MHFLSGFHPAPHRQNTEVDTEFLRQQFSKHLMKPVNVDLKFQGRTIGGGSSLPRKPTTEAERIALETANQEFYNCLEQGYTKEQCELVFAEAFKVVNNEYGASGGGAASPQGEESSNTLLYVGAAAAVFAAVFLLRKRSKG